MGVYDFDGIFGTFSAPENFDTRLSRPDDGDGVRMIEHEVWARERLSDSGHEDTDEVIFIIHEVCWALLEKAHRPGRVPRRRLWEVLRSLTTFDNYLPCWGHDYGGLGVDFTTHDIYTWVRHERRDPESYYWDIPNADPRAAASHVARLLDATPSAPPESKLALTASSTGTDPFFRFPDEMRLEIACSLTVSEALNLRLASRAFRFVFDDHQFWASNFRYHDGDRAWFLGLMNNHDKEKMNWNLDWRSLYRQTHDTHLSVELNNGKRVWTLAKRLRAVLDLSFPYCIPEYGGSCFAGRTLPCIDDNVLRELDDIEWKFQPTVGNFWEGDVWETNFNMHTLFVHVPDALSRLSFSFVPLGDYQYLAGIKIYAANMGQDLEFGYQAPAGRQRSLDIDGLYGFTVAMGSQGIAAIQCMDARGVVGGWIGDPGSFPRTRRLTGRLGLGGKIVAMKAEFDVSARLPAHPNTRRRCNKMLKSVRRVAA